MRRLQIGMWYEMNEEEWNKWNLGMINGLEASQYRSKEDLAELQTFCIENELKFGIHSPVIQKEKSFLPEMTSNEEQKLSEAIDWIEDEVKLASKYGADYILFHYPFPSITPKVVDKEYWPGKPDYPILDWNELSKEEFLERSHTIFCTLSDLQKKYQQKIVLEYDFFGEFEDEFLHMFEIYQDIQLVVDTQRLDVHKRAFPGFEPYSFLEKAAPYVFLVHHSTTRYGENYKRHVPVLPENKDDPDYGAAHYYLEYLSRFNNSYHINFEHNPILVTIEQLKTCYRTAQDIMGVSIGKD